VPFFSTKGGEGKARVYIRMHWDKGSREVLLLINMYRPD
jgi:hypothetical protein